MPQAQPQQQMSGGGGLPFAGHDGRFFALERYKGINTKAKRPAIDDQEFSWLENFMPIGDGNLRTLPNNGTTLYTASAGTTIIYEYFFNVGSTEYVAVFQSDGSAYSINVTTAASTQIDGAGTFYTGSSLPACAQWGNSGIIIVGIVTGNDYWTWDGTTLLGAGQASASWLNGGTPTTMPTGIQGTCIETYQGRVWIGNGNVITFSGPSNGASFSGAVGGGSFASTDSFLRAKFTGLRQANGFLYLFGDSSINVISNVSTSGSPLTTTFNNQNVDPQVGTPWPNTIQAYGRGLVFANQAGVYALYGGSAEKVSDPLDGAFAAAQTILASSNPTQQPSSAVTLIYSIRCYLLVLPVQDLFTGQFRNVCAIWDGKQWFYGSQTNSIVYITTQEINSVMSGWGTDGTNVFALFTTASSSLNKIIQTKLWAGDAWTVIKQLMRSYMQAIDNSGSGYTLSGTIDMMNSIDSPVAGLSTLSVTFTNASFPIVWTGLAGAVLQFTGLAGANLNFTAGGETVSGMTTDGAGCLVGATLQTTAMDMTMIAFAILYRNLAPMGG